MSTPESIELEVSWVGERDGHIHIDWCSVHADIGTDLFVYTCTIHTRDMRKCVTVCMIGAREMHFRALSHTSSENRDRGLSLEHIQLDLGSGLCAWSACI